MFNFLKKAGVFCGFAGYGKTENNTGYSGMDTALIKAVPGQQAQYGVGNDMGGLQAWKEKRRSQGSGSCQYPEKGEVGAVKQSNHSNGQYIIGNSKGD